MTTLDGFQILLFIFAGIAWVGLGFLGIGLYLGLRRLFKGKSKETQHEKDWADIERRLSE